MTTATKKYYASQTGSLRQGEVLENVVLTTLDPDSIGQSEAENIEFYIPLCIVVSQDCDLDWDYDARISNNLTSSKFLTTVLFCRLFPIDANMKQQLSGDSQEKVKNNLVERYHFLEAFMRGQKIVVDEVVADFKQYFAIPPSELYKRMELKQIKRRYCLTSPYLEHFMSRFYNFQSRVALPDRYASNPPPNKK